MSVVGLEPATNFSQLDPRAIAPRVWNRGGCMSHNEDDNSVLGRIEMRIFYHLPVQLARKQWHSWHGEIKVATEIVIIFNKNVSDHEILIILLHTEKR